MRAAQPPGSIAEAERQSRLTVCCRTATEERIRDFIVVKPDRIGEISECLRTAYSRFLQACVKRSRDFQEPERSGLAICGELDRTGVAISQYVKPERIGQIECVRTAYSACRGNLTVCQNGVFAISPGVRGAASRLPTAGEKRIGDFGRAGRNRSCDFASPEAQSVPQSIPVPSMITCPQSPSLPVSMCPP